MKLYYAPGACSLAPHIVLREVDRRFDLERVDLHTKRTASGRDYTEINPKGYVPCLELDGPGSETLTEAQVIVQYVGDLVPDQHLVPPNGTFARYHLQEWLAFIATELHKQFGPMFDRALPEKFAAMLRGKIGERLTYLQGVLTDRPYLMGERFCAADAYLFVMLQWALKFHIDLAMWPHLEDYEIRISERPAVEAAMAAEGLRRHHQYRKTG